MCTRPGSGRLCDLGLDKSLSLWLSFSSVNGDNSTCWTYVPGVLGEENKVYGSARYYIGDEMTFKMEIRVGFLCLVNLPTFGS